MSTYRLIGPRRVVMGSSIYSILQVGFGIVVGFLLGTCINYESETDVENHIMQIEHREQTSSSNLSFSLQCVIMVHPDTKKGEQFMRAIKDGWGSQCNHTTFYTTSKEVQDKMNDHSVILVDSYSNGFYWDFYRQILEHASKTHADWTIVGDEQLFVVPNNLRSLLSGFNPEIPIMVGRVTENSSPFSFIYPFAYGKKISHQAGIVLSNKALREIHWCRGFFFPRSSEKALVECAEEYKVNVVDPVDEDGMHLFHSRDMMVLIPISLQNKTADIKEADGVASCCSDHSITFGRTSYKEQRVAFYGTQNIKVFGANGYKRISTSNTGTNGTEEL